MIRHSNNITGLTALAALALLTGCRSDQGEPLPVHGEGSSLSLLIPVPAMSAYAPGTRAGVHGTGAAVTAGEGTIHTLHLLAYEAGTDAKPAFVHSFSGDEAKPVDGMYVSYTTEVKPGDYHIYLVANVDGYTASTLTEADLGSMSLGDLSGLALTYPDGMPRLAPGHGLPMAGDCQVSVTAGASASAVVDMKFLCSKVRLTVLFDASEDGAPSEDFGVGSTFDVTDHSGYNLRGGIKVARAWDPASGYGADIISGPVGASSLSSDFGYRAGYPAVEYTADVESWLTSLLADGGKALDLAADAEATAGSDRMAWQTTVYMNPFDATTASETAPAPSLLVKAEAKDAKGSVMNTFEYTFFPGCSGTVEGGDCTSWLEPAKGGDIEPGHMYDMVVMATDPGKFMFKIKDMKWEYVREVTDL